MTLTEIMETVVESSHDDWHSIACWGADSGPSYRNQFTFYQTWEHDYHGVLEAESHAFSAMYMPDASITLAYGLSHLRQWDEPWAKKFPDPVASSSYVDVFYSGALVFRDLYVTVDGGRASLPLPKTRHDFIRLINRAPDIYDEYIKRAGFKVTDEPWPTLGR